MKIFITFVKLPFHYMIVEAPNKSIALSKVKLYRDDAVAYANELKFSFEEAVTFYNKWRTIINLEEFCNTQKHYKLTRPDNSVQYYTGREDEFLKYCKDQYPKAQLFTINHERFLVRKVGKENIPLFNIKEVKRIPNQLEAPRVEEPPSAQESEKVEVKDIETEIV